MPSTNTIFQLKCYLEDGELRGHIRTKYSGYSAISERQAFYKDKAGQYWKTRFTGDLQIENFEVKNEDIPQKAFYNEFDVHLAEQLFENEDIIYISPIVYSDFDENPFKAEKRYSNIDLPYNFFDQYLFELDIPQGYEIEELPAPASISLPNNGGSFQYRAMVSGQTIKITSAVKFNQLSFSPKEYPAIKTLFDMIVEKHGEQIVLKKVAGNE
ncbi:MAG: DUF3858 domain-containing protein [Bacteroidota bacterium]